jgi:hypothetical protein
MPEADLVLVAIVGTAGLRPALAAIEAGKDIAVASKEILVMAGEIVMDAARRKGVRVMPVDSEHSAIFQCLEGRDTTSVRRLILTCSGGPFRKTPAADLKHVTPEMALRAFWQNLTQENPNMDADAAIGILARSFGRIVQIDRSSGERVITAVDAPSLVHQVLG